MESVKREAALHVQIECELVLQELVVAALVRWEMVVCEAVLCVCWGRMKW